MENGSQQNLMPLKAEVIAGIWVFAHSKTLKNDDADNVVNSEN